MDVSELRYEDLSADEAIALVYFDENKRGNLAV
jgi:hypothetical protein